MAHNPELDHEFRETKKEEKAIPFVYQDNDHVVEPYEMLAINRDGGLKVSGWKQKIIMAIVVVLAFAVGTFLLYGVAPWLVSIFNPNMQGIHRW